jgi:hypothetical protein
MQLLHPKPQQSSIGTAIVILTLITFRLTDNRLRSKRSQTTPDRTLCAKFLDSLSRAPVFAVLVIFKNLSDLFHNLQAQIYHNKLSTKVLKASNIR